MQAAFTDLVGTAVVPTHCFDTTELTDLTPELDTATDVHDMAEQASEGSVSNVQCTSYGNEHGPCATSSNVHGCPGLHWNSMCWNSFRCG